MTEPARVSGAQDYLHQALSDGMPFAIVTGGADSGKSMLIRRFLQSSEVSHCVHLAAATGDQRSFLERVLEQLGFEPFESSCDEMRKLLNVFAQHEMGQGRHTVLVLEDAQDFGPRVLETVQQLATECSDGQHAISFILTGSSDLERILDSEGMADIADQTQSRYCLDDPESEPGDPALPRPKLEIILRGTQIDRCTLEESRIMIGRHERNDISLDNRFVSRHHALLVSREDAIYVVDLQSTNGTYVNATPVTRHALRDGDVIQIGNYRLRYCEPEGAERPLPTDDIGDHADTSMMGPRAMAS
ncbi:MAG: FHA domain-containing protein [Gammaproteobacteria bacterium]